MNPMPDLTEADLRNLQTAVNELGGFAGREISEALTAMAIDPYSLKRFVDGLAGPEALRSAPRETLLGLFLLNNLVCAALGDEELGTITGAERDSHFLTARRLYHVLTAQGD